MGTGHAVQRPLRPHKRLHARTSRAMPRAFRGASQHEDAAYLSPSGAITDSFKHSLPVHKPPLAASSADTPSTCAAAGSMHSTQHGGTTMRAGQRCLPWANAAVSPDGHLTRHKRIVGPTANPAPSMGAQVNACPPRHTFTPATLSTNHQ